MKVSEEREKSVAEEKWLQWKEYHKWRRKSTPYACLSIVEISFITPSMMMH